MTRSTVPGTSTFFTTSRMYCGYDDSLGSGGVPDFQCDESMVGGVIWIERTFVSPPLWVNVSTKLARVGRADRGDGDGAPRRGRRQVEVVDAVDGAPHDAQEDAGAQHYGADAGGAAHQQRIISRDDLDQLLRR